MTGSGVQWSGYLTKSRGHGMRLPIIRSKWTKRFYMLHADEDSVLFEEYKREDGQPRKVIDLRHLVQVDSHLQFNESSCASRGTRPLQWIFSISYTKSEGGEEKKHELFLSADTEQEMNNWVSSLCRACNLSKQPQNVSVSDAVEDVSDVLRSLPVDISSQPESSQNMTSKNYQHLKNLRSSDGKKSSLSPKYGNTHGEGSSASSISSSLSDDEWTSDGLSRIAPVVPPRQIRTHLPRGSRRDYEGGTASWKSDLDDGMDNESSGETIKIRELPPPIPPPKVDRSKKPMRSVPAIPLTTPRLRVPPPPPPHPPSSTTHFGYFEPLVTRSSPRGHDPHLDYIKIDAQRTQAIKNTIASYGDDDRH